jgi:hypothetical protein
MKRHDAMDILTLFRDDMALFKRFRCAAPQECNYVAAMMGQNHGQHDGVTFSKSCLMSSSAIYPSAPVTTAVKASGIAVPYYRQQAQAAAEDYIRHVYLPPTNQSDAHHMNHLQINGLCLLFVYRVLMHLRPIALLLACNSKAISSVTDGEGLNFATALVTAYE